MKRLTLLLLGLALAWPAAANAQLTMQMPGGWAFTFSGNVNAFLVYEKEDDGGATTTDGGIVGNADEGSSRIRTGLLPAFVVFDAKGREGKTNLGVHFGFAPQIQCGGAAHDCFGAQIDMRQVYLTVGGSWGQILAGRELGLFGRQNILTDQTLYGTGATGGQLSGGTTLGRIGFGYIYPNFVPQVTFSSKSDRPVQVSIGLF
ncbi:MAG: porin, partial [Acidimicrobiales bacterium]